MHKKTKAELALSLKKLTETMPLEKITIGDIAADCGVNRQTFYYHFHDIYELVEWIFSESANAIAEKKSFGMWRQGLIELCLAVKQSRNFIRACYESEYCHKKLLHYLFNETYTLINEIMDEVGADVAVSEDDKKFVADFYKNALAGLFMDWIRDGMTEDPEKFVGKIGVMITGEVRRALLKFGKEK